MLPCARACSGLQLIFKKQELEFYQFEQFPTKHCCIGFTGLHISFGYLKTRKSLSSVKIFSYKITAYFTNFVMSENLHIQTRKMKLYNSYSQQYCQKGATHLLFDFWQFSNKENTLVIWDLTVTKNIKHFRQCGYIYICDFLNFHLL